MDRPKRTAANLPGLFGAFVASSAVLGLLAAGMLMPIVGIAGVSTQRVVTAFDSLPAQFTANPMAQQSRILAADGALIATLYEENRIVVPLGKVSPQMRKAQVAIEDERFYEHGAIDPRGLVRAAVSTLQSDKQGASTITQQYVRQMLVATAAQNGDKAAMEAAVARSGIPGYVRKLQEIKYAISMEQRLSKDDILQGYLNLVYYGAGAYGVEAASKRYFGISAEELNLPQAALIAGLAQNPGTADPINNPDRALARRNDVLQRMHQVGMISSKVRGEAQRAPIKLNVTPNKQSCPASADPYICEYVRRWLLEQPSLGATAEDRRKRLYYGGLTVTTSFDLDLTRQTRSLLAKRVPPANSRDRGAASATVEPGTGRVLAIGQNTEWALEQKPGKTALNWAVDQKYGGSSGFQIGSTSKMYGVVTALEQGMRPGSRLYAPPDGTRYSAKRLGGDKCGMVGSYAPFNAEGEEHGSTTLRQATAESINTAFLELASKVGVCKEKATMAKMGLVRADGQPYGTGGGPGQGLAATILGADNASPLTLAASYATLAANGTYCAPKPVDSVVAFDGTTLPVGENNCRQVVDPKIAYGATDILRSVMTSGTGKSLGLSGRQSAGKTGTADNGVETWFAGYTPQRATAVWYGTPYDQRSTHAYGATIAGPLWTKIMNRAHDGLPAKQFTREQSSKSEKLLKVPNVVDRSRGSAQRRLEREGFSVDVADERVASSDVDAGRVVSSSPGSGQEIGEGETVTLTLSSGRSDE